MATINKETIATLTRLSRIKCTEKEQAELLSNLNQMLDYFELLNEIDTHDVPVCNHVLEQVCNVMREDLVGETMPRELFLANAPSQIGGMIRVPPVIKSKEGVAIPSK
jgi:aspartyl-tRNA(Asn)/glutamyl-tRNA(Gln) amidotransferase subunit C